MSHSERDNDQVSEHLGRLLEHADQLLGEWRDYSHKLRAELDDQAAEAGQRAGQAMRDSLTEFGQAGERLEDLSRSLHKARLQARGLAAVRGPWLVVLVVQLLVGAVLIALVMRSGTAPPPAAVVDAGVIADASAPADALVPDAAPARLPPLCAGLLRGVAKPSAVQLIRACAVVACGHRPPAKVDRGNRALRGTLAKCKPERDGALIQELLQILGAKKSLARCKLSAGDDGAYSVDPTFVASCRGDAGK
ncbi:MAG: hypothetical protein KJO07_07005 [Deltaproteobacteria bacterium]|jgi:hypothetical protein|nr:hypothetical protein [Deltaproteobacteria bacterium]